MPESIPSTKELNRLFRYLDKNFKSKSVITGSVNHLVHDVKIESLKQRRQVIPCEAGRSIGVIMENGDVSACELLPPIGNIRKKSIADIWNSDEARACMKGILNGNCYCTHECFIFPSLSRHPLAAMRQYVKIIWRNLKNEE